MAFKKIAGILFFILLVFIAAWFYKSYKTLPALPAYENTFTNEAGQPVKLSDYKGSYVLISYFQTWCGDCIQELPGIDNLQAKVGNEKLTVLMVSDETKEKINHFKDRYCNTLNYFQSTTPLRELNIRVFPTTYLLNKNGEVIMGKLEGYDWSNDQVIQLIK